MKKVKESIKAWALDEKGVIESACEDRDKIRYMQSVRKKYGVKTQIVPVLITILRK